MQVQKLLHQGQCAVMWRGTTARRCSWTDCQPLALPRLNGPFDEGNPPDDLLAHALRLKGKMSRCSTTAV